MLVHPYPLSEAAARAACLLPPGGAHLQKRLRCWPYSRFACCSQVLCFDGDSLDMLEEEEKEAAGPLWRAEERLSVLESRLGGEGVAIAL